MKVTNNVILVEGFTDRAFVGGILDFLCGRSLKLSKVIHDPNGNPIRGSGHHGMYPVVHSFVKIIPVESKNFGPALDSLKKESNTHPIDFVLKITDADFESSGAEMESRRVSAQANLDDLLKDTPNILKKVAILWHSPTATTEKQNLERLIPGAIAGVKPEWISHVQAFLKAAPNPTEREGKEEAMTVMASWFSERGSEDFYRAIWQHKEIAEVLKAHLITTGLWPHFESLAK
jgi:hypothetical protein